MTRARRRSNQLLATMVPKNGKAVYSCYVEPGSFSWSASNSSIIAVRMTSVSVTTVNG